MSYKRVFSVVLDSVGNGAAPGADKFGDVGADTLGHVGSHYAGKLALPNLAKLGLSNTRTTPIEGVAVAEPALGNFGNMNEISAGKDSMDGHWEMMGLPVMKPLSTIPQMRLMLQR
ncbi:MAG: phosphopentomutase, partial [Limosilactobacillus sp.]|nr:phosphopentomutase [Limosilactobacillus sp.]